MAQTDAPIIQLDTVDSTNNYAMALIDADKAQHGLTITARQQLAGKGQRGKKWMDAVGESLLMSIIIVPNCSLDRQFTFNASIAVAITQVLEHLYENWNIRIKWPNDIIINDKKAGGILIENIIRGNTWSYSIVGIGINILQEHFPVELPFATSLRMESGKANKLEDVRDHIRTNILEYTSSDITSETIMHLYNERLFQKGRSQYFTDGSHEWPAIIQSTAEDGTLLVQLADGSITHYKHGTYNWMWGDESSVVSS